MPCTMREILLVQIAEGRTVPTLSGADQRGFF